MTYDLEVCVCACVSAACLAPATSQEPGANLNAPDLLELKPGP